MYFRLNLFLHKPSELLSNIFKNIPVFTPENKNNFFAARTILYKLTFCPEVNKTKSTLAQHN